MFHAEGEVGSRGDVNNGSMSAVRKGLLWWFDWPGNAHVAVSCAVDFLAAEHYLAALAAQERGAETAPVSVHHLAVAAIARTLREFPAANARILGRRIEPQPQVGVAMPVNLLGHRAGAAREVSIAVVDRAESRTLRELAAATSQAVRAEREGRSENPFVRALTQALEAVPYGVVSSGLDLLHRASRFPPVARALYAQAPFTTVVTNAGAPFALPEGMLFRGAAMSVPQRIFHVGTVWCLSAMQNEVFVIGGEPAVRPALPVVLLFDHRLLDGVMAGRILVRLGEILRDPAKVFGPTGDARIG